MKPHQQKRSVSPFGTAPETETDPLAVVTAAIAAWFGAAEGKPPKVLSQAADAAFIPQLLRKAYDAPANDALWLPDFCGAVARMRMSLSEKGVADAVYGAMEALFERKTELFLVDHHVMTDEEYLEAHGAPREEGKPPEHDYRDNVLFSRERDALVGGFFAPWTEREPGLFSAFVDRWAESENPDRVLHFLDFCAGSRNPTFEHYLLFTHPALARWVSSKSHLRALFDRVAAVLPKIKSPTWETTVRRSLGL